MSDAQHHADEGQQQVELEQSNVFVAWVQARKEMEASLYERLNTAPFSEQNDLRWVLSTEWAEWMRAHPKPPEPPRRPTAKPELHLVPAGYTGPRPYWGE